MDLRSASHSRLSRIYKIACFLFRSESCMAFLHRANTRHVQKPVFGSGLCVPWIYSALEVRECKWRKQSTPARATLSGNMLSPGRGLSCLLACCYDTSNRNLTMLVCIAPMQVWSRRHENSGQTWQCLGSTHGTKESHGDQSLTCQSTTKT